MRTTLKILLLAVMLLPAVMQGCKPGVTKKSGTAQRDNKWLEETTVRDLHEGYKNKKFTVRDVVSAYLDRINEIDKSGPSLNSVITVNPDALKIADSLDIVLADGRQTGPLFGIPVILKDNISTHDKMPNTAGATVLRNSFPASDSPVAAKLRQAGAVILGKSNLSEWANFRSMASTSGWSGVGGLTRNPYVLDRNPCGSSSGSGVAVSANLCILAIGTETNGSIVCPSNNNGIVGLKPTVGLISRSGIIPISFTQDTPGPMGRTVEDVAICLGALTGTDPADPKTAGSEGKYLTDYTRSLNPGGLKGKRIGFIKGSSDFMEKVDTLTRQAIRSIRSLGAEVIEVSAPNSSGYEAASFDVMLYEFKDGLNRYFAGLGPGTPVRNISDLIKFNLTDTVELKFFDQKILEMADRKGDLNSPEYKKDLGTMLKATREEGIDRIMDENRLDALMAPTGSPAWKTDLILGDHYLGGSSSLAAISGYPAIALPMGFIEELPVDITFFGRAWSEPLLLEIAFSYEQGTKHRKAPGFLPTD
jgi:amidase